LVDTSTTDIAGMKKELLGLDSRLGSATELSEGLYQALSASVEPAKAVQFVGESAKFAKAALIDTNTAVDVITTGLNAYGKGAEEAGEISDILFTTIKNGKVTGEELSSTIGQVIPLAANMGLSFKNLGASIATMTKQGVNSAESTTQLNAIMTALLKPSGELSDAMKKAGFDTGEAVTQSDNFQLALQQVIGQTDGSKEALAELFPNVRALRGALALTGDGADSFTDTLNEMSNSSGATDEAFQKQRVTFDTLMNSLNKFAIRIGDFLLPIIDELVNGLTKLLDSFMGNDDLMKGFGDTLQTVFSNVMKLAKVIVGLAVRIGGLLTPLVEAIVDLFFKKVDAVTQSEGAMSLLGDAIGVVSGAISIIVGFVTELLSLIGDTWQEEFEKTINSLGDTEGAAIDLMPVFRALAVIFGIYKAVMSAIIKTTGLLVRALINLAKTAGAAGSVIGEVVKLITFQGGDPGAAIEKVQDQFGQFISDIQEGATEIGKGFVFDLQETFGNVEEDALKMANKFKEASKGAKDAFTKDVKSSFGDAKKTLETDITMNINADELNAAVTTLTDGLDEVVKGQEDVIEGQEDVASGATDMADKIKNSLVALLEDIGGAFQELGGGLSDTEIILNEFVANFIDKLGDLGNSIQQNIVDGLYNVGEAIAQSESWVGIFKKTVAAMLGELTNLVAMQLLSAGLQMLLVGNIPLGLTLIAAAGLTALGGGYIAGLIAGNDEDVQAAASGGVKSGLTLVGEQGPELVNLSSPSRIFPADETRSLTGGVVVNVNFSGPINSDVDLDRAGIMIGKRVQAQARSMAV